MSHSALVIALQALVFLASSGALEWEQHFTPEQASLLKVWSSLLRSIPSKQLSASGPGIPPYCAEG